MSGVTAKPAAVLEPTSRARNTVIPAQAGFHVTYEILAGYGFPPARE